MSEELKKKEVKVEAKVEAKTEVKSEAKGTVEVSAPKAKTEAPKAANARGGNDRRNNNRGPRNGGKRGKFQRRPQEFEERVVNISRVTTVAKGGRRFSFSALIVIGDKKGRVGYGHGKANEVIEAIKKGIKDAKQNIIKVPIIDKRTIPHDIKAKYVSSNVMLRPAPQGKGLIASGAVRAVVELAGYKDIVTKSLGSSNKTNVVKATLKALENLKTIEDVARLRGIKPEEVLG
ncbi:MAG: 30S ribosomal protein S5 [Mycoplasmataceae bacterium]|nr:30S ribosomal protein S5 [Mycoplasmataceae bacterium]